MTFGLAIPLAFLAGVLIADSGAGHLALALLAAGCGALALAFGGIRRGVAMLVLVLLAAAGFWRAEARPAADVPRLPVGASLTLRGVVSGQPKRYPDHLQVQMRLTQPAGEITLSLPPLPLVHDGDLLRLRVTTSAGGLGQPPRIFVTSVTVVQGSTSRVIRLRNWAADAERSAISSHVPEPAGSLALGVVNGDDGGMTDATRQAFRRAGLTHMTAVSGWNLALVAVGVVIVFRGARLPAVVRLLSLLVAVWGYAFLVGMSGSVVRAGAMTSLILVARWRGRPADVVAGLLWGIAVLIACSPAVRADVGFQLSVAATAALALVAPRLIGRPWWQAALGVSVTAELAVTPLALYHFGTFSLLSPLSNLATELLVGPIMLGGALVTLAAWVSPSLADVLGIMTWLPARLVVTVADWTTRLGFGYGQTVALSWSETVIAYALLLSGWYCATTRQLWLAALRRDSSRVRV